jgi:hypothetical protein
MLTSQTWRPSEFFSLRPKNITDTESVIKPYVPTKNEMDKNKEFWQ